MVTGITAPSLALTSTGWPAISYSDFAGYDQKYAEWVPPATTTTITASETNPTFSQLIIFKVTLKAGTTGLSKAVKIWHTDPNGVLIELNPQNTINGVYSWGMSFSDPGQYVFHAEFAGDSQYAPSSGTVTVNVQSS